MKKVISIILTLTIALVSGVQIFDWAEGFFREQSYPYTEHSRAEQLVYTYAQDHGLTYGEYPPELIALLDRNPETSSFVLEYPLKKDKTPVIDLTEYAGCETVPLLMQWDQRWGYLRYGDNVAGLTACGPVCLSMAAIYVTGDPEMSPDRMMEFAEENGYCIPGNGTAWALIGEGGEKLGLDVTELPLHEGTMINVLEEGYPIICIMGPGDFTTTGHFIVLTGVENGAFRVNDPNSYANSEKLWTYEQIEDQIDNLWAIRPGY